MVMDTKNIVLIVLAAACLVIYLLRRRSRLGKDED